MVDPIATLSHLESTYSEATKTLFEEMSALYEHRFEFGRFHHMGVFDTADWVIYWVRIVKSAYLALQKCQ